MNFFHPLSLLWLLPVAGLIVLMYILKLHRKDVVVSSTFLWRQVIRDVQANAPFQKLRRNLLFYLQLLAALLIVVAVARPYWRGRGVGGRSVVIVLDTSASMLATDVGRSRMEEAKREAIQIVHDMKPGDQMMVLSAAAKPEAVTGFTGDRSELTRAISSLRPRETTTNMRDAVNLAAALVAARDASRIDIVSDGAFAPITNVNLGKTHIAFHPVGRTARNVGITAVDYRRSLVDEKSVQVFVTVHNFDRQPHTFTAEVTADNSTLDAREITLPPGAENADIFEVPEPDVPTTIQVRLDVQDDLAVDNRAALLITPRRMIRTLLVTEKNPFLETGIRVDPNVELSVIKLSGFTGPGGYDVVIFDGSAPERLPEGNYLFIDCASDRSPATPGPARENQSVIDASRNHPVLRYVDFGTTRWVSLRRGTPAGWAQEIAASEAGPVIIAGEREKTRALWTGFRLDATQGPFPFTVSYPIFVSNALRWLAHYEDGGTMQVRTGATMTLEAPPGVGSLTIVKPDGSKKEAALSPRGTAVFDDTDQVGLYTAIGSGGYRRVFAANLADSAESDIAPRPNPDLGGNPPGRAGRPVSVTHELWPWLVVVLLGLLGLEWWAYHRRVYVN